MKNLNRINVWIITVPTEELKTSGDTQGTEAIIIGANGLD